MTSERTEIERHLPLTHVAFEILVAVAADERHGYGIMQDIAASTKGNTRLNPGTLYRAINRLAREGLLVQLPGQPAPDVANARRRYYAATSLGIAVARAEAERLGSRVEAARARLLGPT